MKKVPDLPGVYCLKAVSSNLIYIGSTSNLRLRRNNHYSCIRNKKYEKGCKAIIDVAKNEEIEFNVIEITNDLHIREQFWIDSYKQSKFIIVNTFDADRNGSSVTREFKDKMSSIAKKRWKDSEYRESMLKKMKKTHFTPERLNKKVVHFDKNGNFIDLYSSAKEAANKNNLHHTSLASAARGEFRNSFKYKEQIFIYESVLYKLGELLELHQELRTISSEAWEACKSTTNVQRLDSE